MVWLSAIVLLLLIVFVPVVRKVAVMLLAISVVTIAYCSYQSQQEREASRNRVSSAEIEFDDLRLGASSSTYELTGRVRNKSSQYTVNFIGMKIQVKDCSVTSLSVESTCVVVGESDTSLYLNIPPIQVRDFRQYVSFPNDMKIRGHMQWSYTVSYITAK